VLVEVLSQWLVVVVKCRVVKTDALRAANRPTNYQRYRGRAERKATTIIARRPRRRSGLTCFTNRKTERGFCQGTMARPRHGLPSSPFTSLRSALPQRDLRLRGRRRCGSMKVSVCRAYPILDRDRQAGNITYAVTTST
jgi:hypothetical protein